MTHTNKINNLFNNVNFPLKMQNINGYAYIQWILQQKNFFFNYYHFNLFHKDKFLIENEIAKSGFPFWTNKPIKIKGTHILCEITPLYNN